MVAFHSAIGQESLSSIPVRELDETLEGNLSRNRDPLSVVPVLLDHHTWSRKGTVVLSQVCKIIGRQLDLEMVLEPYSSSGINVLIGSVRWSVQPEWSDQNTQVLKLCLLNLL